MCSSNFVIYFYFTIVFARRPSGSVVLRWCVYLFSSVAASALPLLVDGDAVVSSEAVEYRGIGFVSILWVFAFSPCVLADSVAPAVSKSFEGGSSSFACRFVVVRRVVV